MIDLITKENSFYALYNEPFGDILKAYFIKSPAPALLGMVADAPAPVDKDVTQIAKNVVQFAAQRMEISGIKSDPRQIVADILNEIDRQLKIKELTNGVLCCSVIVIYDNNLYIGGVGDCTIALVNERGSLRFCHDGPDEPRPHGVEDCSIAPAELMGLGHDARLGDLPSPYSNESVYQFESDQSLSIYMFSDGLTKHIPDFFVDLPGQKAEEVFARVNLDIPKETEDLLDDICFTVFEIPPELAPQQISYPSKNDSFGRSSKCSRESSKRKSKSGSRDSRAAREKIRPGGCGFSILFTMLLLNLLLLLSFAFLAVSEWMNFKEQIFEILNRP